jgi:hypothetical protein
MCYDGIMSAVPLGTHEVVKEVKTAGFTDEQAEAVTRVVRNAQIVDLANLATKMDVAALTSDLQLGLAAAKSDLAGTQAEILKWMVSAIGIQTVVIISAVIALVRIGSHQ